ncbi:hypothetical protein [Parafrankia sp. EUN1f]|uniref:hypothetical protein n=1 Tax=Parafrankia sp. EUN1f TaxID=102897 RepID=UPI0001C44D42|nr:hypothetical protein [Parafrankia sp. EUN1f]EFC86584.1 hypothetical protein FrEUN1fDRAFT_0269 [Parafrankia sp. EUN1f]
MAHSHPTSPDDGLTPWEREFFARSGDESRGYQPKGEAQEDEPPPPPTGPAGASPGPPDTS